MGVTDEGGREWAGAVRQVQDARQKRAAVRGGEGAGPGTGSDHGSPSIAYRITSLTLNCSMPSLSSVRPRRQ